MGEAAVEGKENKRRNTHLRGARTAATPTKVRAVASDEKRNFPEGGGKTWALLRKTTSFKGGWRHKSLAKSASRHYVLRVMLGRAGGHSPFD